MKPNRILLIVDTPNIAKSVAHKYGQDTRPDYYCMIRRARATGVVVAAVALVNDGVNESFSKRLRAMGYQVKPSHAFDCDDAFVSWTVRLHALADSVMVCSGDHGYCALVSLLKAVEKRIVLCAVSGSCNQRLRKLSDEYIETPFFVQRRLSAETAIAAKKKAPTSGAGVQGSLLGVGEGPQRQERVQSRPGVRVQGQFVQDIAHEQPASWNRADHDCLALATYA